MLNIVCVDGVEYPVEAEDGINYHGYVVDPDRFEGEVVPEEAVLGVGVEETPIHNQIPNTAIDCIDSSTKNKKCSQVRRLI